MSIAALHSASFYKEVSINRLVWAIRDAGGFPAPLASSGKRAMPFWSSQQRAQNVIHNVLAYKEFQAVPIPWQEFCDRWVPGLTRDGLLAGINWSGEHATGYDVEPSVLQQNVEALLHSG